MKTFKLFDKKIDLVIYILVPLCIGFIITKFNYVYVISAAAIIVFFYLDRQLQFYTYILSIFYPIVLKVGPINELPLYLIVIPLFFSSMLASMLARKQKLHSRDNRLFVFALTLLFICIAIGYVRNSFSIFSVDLEDSEAKLIGQAYITAFAGIITFFASQWFFSMKLYNQDNLLRFFIFSALLFAFIRFITYFGEYAPFLLSSGFKYSEPGTGALRLGGVDICVGLGIPALVAYSSDRVTIPRVLLMLVFLVVGVMGGGRALFFGVLFSLVIYLSLFHKKYSTKFILACGIIIIIVLLLSQFVSMPGQIERISGLTALEQSFEQQDPGRSITYSYYWDIFLKNPLFGKGIGTYEVRLTEHTKFVTEQLIDGGHGSYLSIICIFGIGGGIFLCIMLFGGITRVYRLFMKNRFEALSVPYKKLVIFIMLFLITTAFYYITSGAGYQDLKLYLVVGMLLGITEKTNTVKNNFR